MVVTVFVFIRRRIFYNVHPIPLAAILWQRFMNFVGTWTRIIPSTQRMTSVLLSFKNEPILIDGTINVQEIDLTKLKAGTLNVK